MKQLSYILLYCLAIFIAGYPAAAQEKHAKTWSSISSQMKYVASSMRNRLKGDNYRLVSSEKNGSLLMEMYEDPNDKYEHWALGESPDTYTVGFYNDKVECLSFTISPKVDETFIAVLEKYGELEKEFLVDDFVHVGFLQEKFTETYFFQNKAKGLKIKIVKTVVGAIVKGIDVYVYGGEVSFDDEEKRAAAYLRSSGANRIERKILYDLSTPDKLATALNTWIRDARINFTGDVYTFRVNGKTSFERSSFEFIVKNNQLYIRMNIPQNGTCDYGLKEIPARWTGQSGSNSSSFYIAFKYIYTCGDKKYETIYVNFSKTGEDPDIYQKEEVKRAIRKCCW